MADIRFTSIAKREFSDLPGHIRKRAVQLIDQVLTEFPLSGKEVAIDGESLRMLPISPFPYLILYWIREEILWVQRFPHARQNWKK